MTANKKTIADFVVHNLDSTVLYLNPYKGPGTRTGWDLEEKKSLSIAAKDGIITWIGPSSDLSDSVKLAPDTRFYNGEGLLATPGLVDSHTHLVYSGDRSDEFEMRVRGQSYLDILAKGGGILKTTGAIRDLSEEVIFEESAYRLETAMEWGTTAIEIKTGYGLDLKNELKMLRVIERLKQEYPIRIFVTFMGAHAIPAEYRSDPDKFVDEICKVWIPEVAKTSIAQFNDVFTENKAFSVAQSRKILEAGIEHGLKPKIHADEINIIGAVDLAVELQAVSADHLLVTDDYGIKKLATSNVIPTVLPGTSTYLMENHHAPARKMIEAGLPLAIASDHNPGSCQFLAAPLIQSLAMLQLKMSAAEALIAGTLHSAHALCAGNDLGSIEVGKKMDLALFEVESYKQIAYQVGNNSLYDLIIDSQPVFHY